MPRTGRPYIDIAGQTFGTRTVTGERRMAQHGKHCMLWRCLCVCGRESWHEGYRLRRGTVPDCECSRRPRPQRPAQLPKFVSLAGRRFGQWTVTDESRFEMRGEFRKTLWKCRCDCGKVREVLAESLTKGKSTNCGHVRREKVRQRNYKHGRSETKLHVRWLGIIARCEQESHKGFHRYGGRGIRVCQRWRNSFVDFITDMGEPADEKLKIDRIDNDGHYSCGHCPECVGNGWPANCRWVTNKANANNTRHNRFIEFDGLRLTMAQWAERLGVSYHIIRSRRRAGWTPEAILTTPTLSYAECGRRGSRKWWDELAPRRVTSPKPS